MASKFIHTFVWHDVFTSDVKKTAAYYKQLCGWEFKQTIENWVLGQAHFCAHFRSVRAFSSIVMASLCAAWSPVCLRAHLAGGELHALSFGAQCSSAGCLTCRLRTPLPLRRRQSSWAASSSRQATKRPTSCGARQAAKVRSLCVARLPQLSICAGSSGFGKLQVIQDSEGCMLGVWEGLPNPEIFFDEKTSKAKAKVCSFAQRLNFSPNSSQTDAGAAAAAWSFHKILTHNRKGLTTFYEARCLLLVRAHCRTSSPQKLFGWTAKEIDFAGREKATMFYQNKGAQRMVVAAARVGCVGL